MVDAVLARLAQNSMYIRDDLTDNKHQLDADSVIDPTDRSFGIESSNLLQEYYPKTPLMGTPHKPTHGFFVLPGDVGETRQTTAPRSVQPPRARAKSAHPNNRHQAKRTTISTAGVLYLIAMYGTWGNKKKALDSTAPFRYFVVKGDTLSSIAIKTKQAEDKIREMNPMVFCSKNATVYPGQELIVDESLAVSLPPPPELIDHGWGQMHVVRSGDTVKTIAVEYNTTEEFIRSDNRQYFPQGERGILFPGQMLHIRVVNTQQSDELVLRPGDVVHVVTSNDTFESIAATYHTTRARILLKNKSAFPIGHKPRLTAGTTLIVGHNAEIADRVKHVGEVKLTKQIHEVEYGETPESICELYGMTMDEMRDFNRAYFPKGYRGDIRPSFKLVVKRQDSNAIDNQVEHVDVAPSNEAASSSSSTKKTKKKRSSKTHRDNQVDAADSE
ncbi:hypothetical protein DYB25_003348 [Aphanomyces astaci]|uniref:LysM domain-containing protein n=2 Tax=Aphanomyces astaci TaxID=112090 RepID=A0A397A1P6_APHAT|nr:hypothetical protein DYB25_003348 [Aphanomyces astaci]RHY53041.1 hypothetical protein DYB38_000374 [Aphanomyces astaci]RHY84085.1 hypothetical protein DYB26_003437 [Aphanomyces astaci]